MKKIIISVVVGTVAGACGALLARKFSPEIEGFIAAAKEKLKGHDDSDLCDAFETFSECPIE